MTALPDESAWARVVAEQATAAGLDLSRQTLDELGAHLDDVYRAARERGSSDADARAEAALALEQSGLWPLQHDGRPDPQRVRAALADDVAAASSRRGVAMGYALRMAWRQLRLHPGFTGAVVLVLGIGTGAAAAVYSIVDSVVLRPLPYAAPDRLVKFWDTNTEKGLRHDPISPVTFMDYRALPVFEDAAAWWRPDVNLVDPGLEPVRVKTIEASANLFSVLGVAPQLGEGFPRGGPLHAMPRLAVISDRLWRSRYGASPAIIGRTLSLNDTDYTVTGVMPPGFHFPDDVDVWQRLQWDLQRHSRGAHFMEAVARLAPDVTLAAARGAADVLAARLGQAFPATNRGWAFGVVPLLDDTLGYYRPALYVLFGAVGLIFVIGCLNVASLLLTRALSREREMTIRVALGAGPRQIVTQLIAESLLLSLAGAVAGVIVATIAVPLAAALTPVAVPRLAEAAVNGRVLGLAVALVAAMTIVFGLVPSLVLLRASPGAELRTGERGNSRATRWLHQSIVVAEVALACVLLASSALLIRTVSAMARVPVGVNPRNVSLTTIQLTAASSRHEAWETLAAQHATIVERVREQPGVVAAGSANFLPFEHGWRDGFVPADQPPVRPEDRPQIQHHSVSEGYLETMGARLVDGRTFTAQDRPDTEPVVLVNESLARRFYGAASPVGREIISTASQIGPLGTNLTWRLTPDGRQRVSPRTRIIGVVADIRNTALGLPVEPAIYHTTRQFPFASVTIAISASEREAAARAVRAALREVSPNTPVGVVETWQDRVDRRTSEPRLLMTMLTAFGGLAALLAAVGVYALFSWSVSLQRRSLAIRLTLGASPASVGAMVVRRSATLVVLGVVAGLALLYAGRGVLAMVLFGVAPGDAASIASAATLLAVAALLATVPPAWRAMRVDPVEGLRAE